MRSGTSTQVSTGRGAAGTVRRAVLVVAVWASLASVPGVAAAVPTNPSDAAIGAARETKDAAAQQVGALAAQLADAQAHVDAAHAASAIALDVFQGKQADHETAQVAADAAAAAGRRADAALAAARAAIADFARASYMGGSTDPGIEALLNAGGPAQMLERAALLDAAGQHRADVVEVGVTAQERAAAAHAAAERALAEATRLEREAADALAAAEQLETAARRQAAAFAAQQAAVQSQLDEAQRQLLGLEGARAAAARYAAAQQAATSQHAAAAGAGSSAAAETAISAARRWLGTRYAWGGGSPAGPSVGWGIDAGVVGFDCSGLTRYAYAKAGISIARNSSRQYATLPKVSRAELQRGDLVFWATDTSRPATIHHVALYLGGGQILEAPQSGSNIRVTAMRWAGFIGGVRPTA